MFFKLPADAETHGAHSQGSDQHVKTYFRFLSSDAG